MDSGKRFEQRFHNSLRALPGASMRIEDGGMYAMNRQLGDFFFWPEHPATLLFECKAERTKSFDLRRVQWGVPNGQIDRMAGWAKRSAGRFAYIALNFYDHESYRKKNACYIIPLGVFESLAKRAEAQGRKSIPEKWLGDPVPNTGSIYDLRDWLKSQG